MSCCGSPPAPEDLAEVSAMLGSRLAGFLRTLRDNAFAVGLAEGRDAATLLQSDIARRPGRLRSAFKHLFCARREDWTAFDAIFDAYWLNRRVKRVARVAGSAPGLASPSLQTLIDRSGRAAAGVAEAVSTDGSPPGDSDAGPAGRMEGASRAESLETTDFRKLADPDAIAEAHAIAGRLAARMRARLTRRERIRRCGRHLDLRRTIHRNISHGGVPVSLAMRRRKPKPLRLVILLDASGSMSPYTSVFVRFVHGVLDEFREAEAFLFHTRLVHVSAAMHERDPARALDRLSMMAAGVGGGTRIGESLATFNTHHAARVIHSRTCVMIVSDGYETGDAGRLGMEMRRLARRCRRIVWLNPMIGWTDYAPEAAGMQAALPHVDLFAPAHDLKSLAALEPYLARL
ncbi:vWA domain-containing protein [Tepidamorphus gemmatus]|nr:VWA domain-containing protein [Tepidamorphus gemmatus]